MTSLSSTRPLNAVAAAVHKSSNGASSTRPNYTSTNRSGLWLVKNPLSSISSSSNLWCPVDSGGGAVMRKSRRVWTFAPLCMGRRSSKIAGRKTNRDAKKMKLYTRVGKELVSAIKKGGTNPTSNTTLATLIEKCKELDIPKEIVERNIKRATEKGQEEYIEKIYEVYGYGGASIVVEVLTDKITRSVAAVREVVKGCGGKMADSGSVVFKFRRARVVNIKAKDVDKDQLLSIALDAGAEDVIEPPIYVDDTEEDTSDRYFKIVTNTESYTTILSQLREEGIPFEPDNGSELLPLTPIEVDDEALDLNKDLIARLLDLDDVDAVYTDQI